MNSNHLIYLLRRLASKPLSKWAEWRIGATELEKKCYKQSDSILLTFDDYGDAQAIAALLRILRTKKVKAMFFLTGDWAEKSSDIVNQITAAGHLIGNHTYSHTNLLNLSTRAVESQIKRGIHGPWLRPPQGRYNQRIRQQAKDLGYVICYWTIDSRDWKGISAEAIKYRVLHNLHPGAVILFHLHAPNTLQSLPSLIDEIRQRGYQMTEPNESWQPDMGN